MLTDDSIDLITPPLLPTYVNPITGSTSTLDLCLVSTDLIAYSEVMTGGDLSSDHYPVIISLNKKVRITPMKYRPRWKLDGVDWQKFVGGQERMQIDEGMELSQQVVLFETKIVNSTYRVEKTKGIYNPKYCRPWWNDECAKLVALKRKAKNAFRRRPVQQNLIAWRQAEVRAKNHIAKSKKESWENFTSTLGRKSSSAYIWRVIKKISGNFQPSHTSLLVNNEVIYNPIDKANAFAENFAKIFNVRTPDQKRDIEMYFQVQEAIFEDHIEQYNCEFKREELQNVLKTLKTTSPGVDDVHNLFLKNISSQYEDFLLHLINRSWKEETIPDRWKMALMVPILKPGKESHWVQSYRPVSMLSCVSKVLEKLVGERMKWYIEKHRLLSDSQVGFRAMHSTYDSLTVLESYIKGALSQGDTCIVVFVDLASAFDRVWHTALLYKMKNMGFKGRLLGWMSSYLLNRKFKVVVNGEYSETKNIKSGVPQGAILSPILFNIMVSDIVKVYGVQYSEYADDIAIYFTCRNQRQAVEKVNEALDELQRWAEFWGQKISIDKTKAMYFTNRLDYPASIWLSGHELEYVRTYKFLGVIFDSPKLSFRYHVEHVKKRCIKKVAIMKSICGNRWGADRRTLLQFYTSCIRSIMDYACHVYTTAANQYLKELDVLQNQCLRLALGVRNATPIISLNVKASIPPLSLRREYLTLKYYNKIKDYSINSPIV